MFVPRFMLILSVIALSSMAFSAPAPLVRRDKSVGLQGTYATPGSLSVDNRMVFLDDGEYREHWQGTDFSGKWSANNQLIHVWNMSSWCNEKQCYITVGQHYDGLWEIQKDKSLKGLSGWVYKRIEKVK